jgi:general secretion pathway protein L
MSTATQPLRPLLDRLSRGWRGSPLPRFFAWWGGELRGMLPARWREWFSDGADWYLLQRSGPEWVLRRAGQAVVLVRCADDERSSDAGSTDAVGDPKAALGVVLKRADREDLRLALLLPAATALRRTLSLPAAARENLQQVVAFEMDRQTPFSVSQVYYAVRELATPAAEGRFNAELVAVTRSTLDPLLARLRALDITVDAVDLADGDDRLGVNLLPPGQVPHRRRPRARLNLALTAACVLLLVLLLGEWLHNRQAALEQMQSQVESMRGEAEQVAALRQQLQDNAGAAGFLAKRKSHTIAMLSLLQDITGRLPDSAWLERFNVDNTGQVGMQGQATQATKLLDALKDSPLITDASFQGSIQPDPGTGKERFYLTAQLRQPAAAGGKRKAPASSSSSAGGAP